MSQQAVYLRLYKRGETLTLDGRHQSLRQTSNSPRVNKRCTIARSTRWACDSIKVHSISQENQCNPLSRLRGVWQPLLVCGVADSKGAKLGSVHCAMKSLFHCPFSIHFLKEREREREERRESGERERSAEVRTCWSTDTCLA